MKKSLRLLVALLALITVLPSTLAVADGNPKTCPPGSGDCK